MHRQPQPSLQSVRGLAAALALAAFLTAVTATQGASAPPETSRQALEAGLAKARKKLPATATAYSDAMRAMIHQDPKRGAELIREALRFPRKGRWERASADYFLVDGPFSELLGKDFDLAMSLALEHPDRLFDLISGRFHELAYRDTSAAERWAPVLIKRQPARGTQLMSGVITSQLHSLSYLNQKRSGAEEQARRSLHIFERFTPMLPPGPERARIKMQAGFHAFSADRSRALKWLEEAVDENPGGRPDLDQGLWRQGQGYVQQPEGGLPLEGWRKLAEQYRVLGSEAGVAGVVRQMAALNPVMALKLAPEIRDPSLRALALSELLEVRGYHDQDFTPSRNAAAAQVAILLPRIERPVLRAFVAYRVAYWQRESEAKLAAANFRLAYDLMRRHQREPSGIFGAQYGFMAPAQVRGLLLGHLSHYRPEEAVGLALSERKALAEHFPMVVFQAAAHAESGRTAERWLRDYLPSASREENRRAYGVCVTEEHPERAAALVPTMPAGYTRDVFLIVVVERLAARDPDAALRLSRHFVSNDARCSAYLGATHAARDRGVAEMLRMAGAIPLPLIRADAMAVVIDQVLGELDSATPAELAEARRVAEGMPDEGPKWRSMERIASEMGAFDADAGLRYARSIDRYTERVSAERTILASLVPKQMERALSLAAREPSEEGRVDLIAGLANGLATANPEAAVSLAEKLEHRPTREQVLASAIEQIQKKDLDRALELAPQVVMRSASYRVFPRLWLEALNAKKSPSQVWPLYRPISHDLYSLSGALFEEHRRSHPDDDRAFSVNVHRIAADRTVAWLRGFSRTEWLTALQPYLAGDAQGRIDPDFLARIAVTLAPAAPDDALALADAAKLEESGWSWLASTLCKKHPEQAEQALERIKEPHLRTSAWLELLESALARKEPIDTLRKTVVTETGLIAAGIRKQKLAAERARGYLRLAGYLQRGRLDPGAYLRLARSEAARVRAPLVRAGILHALETFPK